MTVEPQSEPFAWEEAMAFGLGVLKLPPAQFWNMTPRELEAALRGHYGRGIAAPAFGRPSLQALMTDYPDMSTAEETADEQ